MKHLYFIALLAAGLLCCCDSENIDDDDDQSIQPERPQVVEVHDSINYVNAVITVPIHRSSLDLIDYILTIRFDDNIVARDTLHFGDEYKPKPHTYTATPCFYYSENSDIVYFNQKINLDWLPIDACIEVETISKPEARQHSFTFVKPHPHIYININYDDKQLTSVCPETQFEPKSSAYSDLSKWNNNTKHFYASHCFVSIIDLGVLIEFE